MVSALGRYWPWLVGGPFLICIGSGLLFTITEDTSSAKLIGYQIVRLHFIVATFELLLTNHLLACSFSDLVSAPFFKTTSSLSKLIVRTRRTFPNALVSSHLLSSSAEPSELLCVCPFFFRSPPVLTVKFYTRRLLPPSSEPDYPLHSASLLLTLLSRLSATRSRYASS